MTVDGLLEAQDLKELPRAGWVRVGVADAETVAAHSWGVALLVLTLIPPDLDLRRALTYAVLHDLPELRAGDVTPADGVSPADKRRREVEAMDGLARVLPRGELLAAAWRAYEEQADEEARFVRQLDRLDMALRARRYQDLRGADLGEFLASARAALTDPALARWVDAPRQSQPPTPSASAASTTA